MGLYFSIGLGKECVLACALNVEKYNAGNGLKV